LRAAIEPWTGERLAQVKAQRTKKEYPEFGQALAARYPGAKQLRLVRDNLNTHNARSFYEHLPAAEAFARAARFEFLDTPKAASWLNLIEIEFSALARECLHRRIPTQEILEREVRALVKERAEKKLKLNWQFSLETARTKLNRHYRRVNADNIRYQETWLTMY
jgi:hypothetical protein